MILWSNFTKFYRTLILIQVLHAYKYQGAKISIPGAEFTGHKILAISLQADILEVVKGFTDITCQYSGGRSNGR
jgi:hypothetical protein